MKNCKKTWKCKKIKKIKKTKKHFKISKTEKWKISRKIWNIAIKRTDFCRAMKNFKENRKKLQKFHEKLKIRKVQKIKIFVKN